MTALILDEMLSGAIAEHLRRGDIDAVAVVDDRTLIGLPDPDVLAYAAQERRVLVTANIADFAKLSRDWQATQQTHGGIIYVTYRAFPQDRSYMGALVSSLTALVRSERAPRPGDEVFLERVMT